MNLADLTLRNRVVAWVTVVLVLAGGWLAYESLGRFEDPEFVIRQAVISTPYPGALPSEVAEEVTDVIEEAVQQLQELKEVTSISREGMSQVTVEIDMKFARNGAQLEQVWDKLRRKIADAARSLPPGAGPPIVNDDFGDVFALFFAVTGDGYTLEQIADYVDGLKRELLLVPGVARVATLGERREAIFVEVSSERATRFGIPLNRIYDSLEKQNVIKPAGDARVGDQRLLIQPSGLIDSVEAIGSVAIGSGEGGRVIFLRDLATITRGYIEPPSSMVHFDGRAAIGLGVSNITGGNVVAMGDAVRKRLAELESQRPVGIELNVVSYQSDSVRAAVDGFVQNLIAAVAIVVVVLLVFMGLRSGLIIGVTLVLTVAGTLICMALDDIAMQRISLGALIIALGMLVDNAIVVTDGILVRMQRGEDAGSAARAVVKSTTIPLLGGTAVGILAFSAIGLSPSDMGEYAGSLFWVILYSMLLSWVFAITLTPLFCVVFLRTKASADGADPYGHPILRAYRRLLTGALRGRVFTGVALLVLLVAGVVGMGFVPAGFMPESARPQFVVDFYLPQGTAIETTARELAKVEEKVRAKEGVTHVSTFIGQGGLRFMLTYVPENPNTSYGQLLVDVNDFRRIPALIATLQHEIETACPEANVKVWKFMLGKGGGKKIEVAFRGPDPKVLRGLAEQAKTIMHDDPEAVAVQDNWRQKVPVIRPKIDKIAAERAGISVAEISAAFDRAFRGAQVGFHREGDKLLPIIARAPASERATPEQMRNVQVFSPAAQRYVPAGQLIDDIEVVWEDALIRRINRFPTIKAQADPPPGMLAAPVRDRIAPLIEAIQLPAGYAMEWQGEYKDSHEANAGLAASAPFGFLAMILSVVVMFNAFRQPLVIWLTVPLAVVGVAIGLLVFQTPFEFMAILGFLSLTGMLVKNSIVLVCQADDEIAAGKAKFAAVIDAAVSRARPVFLGALTTVLGVAPLFLDPFFKSMAITIIFGLTFATGLTLLVVPLLYVVFFRIPAAERPG
jgi:multidrug efflux pump subunit AcrB